MKNLVKNLISIWHYKVLVYIFMLCFSCAVNAGLQSVISGSVINVDSKSVNLDGLLIDHSVADSNVLLATYLKSESFSDSTFNLFSHGRPGELYIDGQWLQGQQLSDYLMPLVKEKNYLSIYGCEFAKGKKGLKAVAYLEKELGISVNASTNITGKDGDWVLEVGNVIMTEFQGYSFNLQLDDTHYIPPFTSEFDSNANCTSLITEFLAAVKSL